MDVHSPEQRSFNMSRIRGKDTQPEIMVRRWLWANGYRYRLYRKDLPGKPDIVLSKYRAAIFVHGCYWHRHGCRMTTTPESRKDFWITKFNDTIKRDKSNVRALLEKSWRVMVIWECSLHGKDADFDLVAKQIKDFLHSDVRYFASGSHVID
ncbi:DNA mismatch endonuclease Vsr [Chlorobaculum thiosulfatiphilum]|jgi:DNA mismatch endonuclease (patch repair protein)|uniref:Very short patch repair endonuclease n=1 Tax=Chlorobaculum thiosulfatiphilum TaxID=115852 RepID=A0A5C4S6Z4_CHLTI|nr:very short patch repair endonuclease [Chlorobaculum thiosulfatiphilum]TNJ38511.1 DNA mismatch endonuclease Vsr [Chlorobaculum thiosulfatiphilum]